MPQVTPITATQLKDLATSSKVLILDVRSQNEIERTGIIPGARHIPAAEVPKKSRANSPEFDSAFQMAETIVVYCAMGARSSAVAEALVNQGYPDVRDLGKLSNWLDAGLPVKIFS